MINSMKIEQFKYNPASRKRTYCQMEKDILAAKIDRDIFVKKTKLTENSSLLYTSGIGMHSYISDTYSKYSSSSMTSMNPMILEQTYCYNQNEMPKTISIGNIKNADNDSKEDVISSIQLKQHNMTEHDMRLAFNIIIF